MLCQLEHAWVYAKKQDRLLVVDTRASGLLASLSDYYDIQPAWRSKISWLEGSGFELAARDGFLDLVRDNKVAHSWTLTNGRSEVTEAPDPTHPFLLHLREGKTEFGIRFLEKLTLKADVRDAILDAVKPLGRDYVGIHIRNTDYQTDFKMAFEVIRSKLNGKRVLLNSDDSNAILYFQETFGDICTPVTTSSLDNLDGTRLHYQADGDCRANNLAMLIDLYALALGRQFFMVDVDSPMSSRSGFAMLAARMLRRIRPVGTTQALSLGPRWQGRLRSTLKGVYIRIYRARIVKKGETRRYFLHPTYE